MEGICLQNLSFRIRFSGEESAVQRADRNDRRVPLPLRDLDEKNYPSEPIKLSSVSDFRE